MNGLFFISDRDNLLGKAVAESFTPPRIEQEQTAEGIRLRMSYSYTTEPIRRAAEALARQGRIVALDQDHREGSPKEPPPE